MRAGQHDGVAFGVTQPTFPVGVFTAMARFEDLRFHLFGTSNRGVEIVEFKPQEHAIAVGFEVLRLGSTVQGDSFVTALKP